MEFPRSPYRFCYVAFKNRFSAWAATLGAERHISTGATLRTKCGAPHFMREIRTSSSEGGGIEANRCFLPYTYSLNGSNSPAPAIATANGRSVCSRRQW
jgi:hypothetical protein